MAISYTRYIWFGIPGKSMQWVPAPEAGFQRTWSGNSVTNSYHDGRQNIQVSAQMHSQFQGTYFGDYTDSVTPSGIDIFQLYASGFYGRGPICFANPYAFQKNMFAPSFASPGLAKYGWSDPIGIVSSYPNLTVSNGRTPTSVTGNVTTSPFQPQNTVSRYNQYIAIPPNMTLTVGWSGNASGTAGIVVQPYNVNNSLAAANFLGPLSVTASTQTNGVYPGSIYNAVRIFVSRQDTTTSAITLNSMMARLWPSDRAFQTVYDHVPGQGNLALAITGDSIAETYEYAGIKKSLALTLEEVA